MASALCGVNPLQFAQSIPRFISIWTILGGMFQSLIYGTIVASVACYNGFTASGGARGVGRAVTMAAVYTNFYIVIANFLSSEFLEWIGEVGRYGWEMVAPMTEPSSREQYETIRDIFRLMGETLKRAFVRPWRWQEIIQSIVQIGIGSIPIIAVSTAFAGMVVTNEIAYHMDLALHTVTMIPGFTGQFILRELGIAIPALLLVAKVGAAITAEVGSMKVTEQIDALKLLGIDPISYLVFPRFVASIISAACLTLTASAVTLGCAILIAIYRYNFLALEYINELRHFIGAKDIICALGQRNDLRGRDSDHFLRVRIPL